MSIPKIEPYLLNGINETENKTDLGPNGKWSIDSRKSILLIHDMQNYFVDFYDPKSEPMKSVISNTLKIRSVCHDNNIPVVYTAQPGNQDAKERALLTDFWGKGLSADGYSENICIDLSPESQDTSYTKWRYSAFQRTPLLEKMQDEGRTQLIVCGIYAHIGILTTTLEAFMNDIQCFVVADAVADFSIEDHKIALRFISQRCGNVLSLKDTVSQIHASRLNENNNDKWAASTSRHLLTMQSMKEDIASKVMMDVKEIEDDDNLLDLGLDSMRFMSLVEQWRGQGVDIKFSDLAHIQTLSGWWAVISRQHQIETEKKDHQIVSTSGNVNNTDVEAGDLVHE